MWIKICNSQSSKETELFAETLNGHGDFLTTSPLCYLLKPDTQPHDESMQRYVPFIFVVSTTSWIILGLSLLARKNPCVIFSEQAKEAKATLFRSVEYAVSTTAKGNSLNEAAF